LLLISNLLPTPTSCPEGGRVGGREGGRKEGNVFEGCDCWGLIERKERRGGDALGRE
jgi:hypothetical protein